LVSARSKQFPKFDADVLMIATKDDKITEVAKRAVAQAPNVKLVVHLAGSMASDSLPNRRMRLTLHPIQTFPKADDSLLTGIYWMASSNDAAGIRWARTFTTALGGKGVIELPSDALPLYHAMTVFSSNFFTLLVHAIEQISVELGENPKRMKAALRPLMRAAVRNALEKPARDVLTGPIARNDLATIRKHRQALKAMSPELRKLYDAFINVAM